jgi:hypothetical protein
MVFQHSPRHQHFCQPEMRKKMDKFHEYFTHVNYTCNKIMHNVITGPYFATYVSYSSKLPAIGPRVVGRYS